MGTSPLCNSTWEEERNGYGIFKNGPFNILWSDAANGHLALLNMDNNLLIQKPLCTTPAESISDVMNRDTDELIKGMRFGGCLGTGERDLLLFAEACAGLCG